MEKYMPSVGDKLYISQRTGSYYIDACKRPFTVIEKKTDNKFIIQEAKLIFSGPRYYDTLPDDIVENHSGRIEELKWSKAKNSWIVKDASGSYPYFATFGNWEYFPYLD